MNEKSMTIPKNASNSLIVTHIDSVKHYNYRIYKYF